MTETTPHHVLVIDDEARIREVVEYALGREGYRVSSAKDGTSGLEIVARDAVDLVVLDVSMPGIDGLEVCRRIRAVSGAGVLFLSARSDEIDRVVGLEVGGDDYLVKPFSPRELVARVKAILRRAEGRTKPEAAQRTTSLTLGRVSLDRERHEVRCGDALVKLTATEFSVLATMLERPGIVFSRAQLVQRAYAYDHHVTERTVDTYVRRIRAKLREHGEDPIETVHGVGYKAATP